MDTTGRSYIDGIGAPVEDPAGMDSDREETPENDDNSDRCGVCNRTKVQKEDDNILNKVHLEMSPEAQMMIAGDLDQLVKRDNTDNFWICCDGCRSWFHSSCVHVQEYESALIAAYHCADCVPRLGPSTWKESVLEHRHNDDKEEERHKPEQVGSKQWIRNLIATERDIPPLQDHLIETFPDGNTFMKNFDHSQEWKKPMLIQKPEGLGLRMPEGTFDIDDCVRLVGGDAIIDTIDVYAQKSYHMTMERFAQLWKGDRKRLYNILSLEISQHRLGEIVDMPQLVRELSWAERFWSPLKSTHMYSVPDWLLKLVGDHLEAAVLAEHVRAKPNVEKFCLLSMGGSFTDCHIDFGGSSVWYHVYEGAKVFFVAPPTEENLQAYEDHCHDEHKTEHYMGVLLRGGLRRVSVAKGETLMIPSGWIHSVYTPVDSIVFGGNFLHDLNIAMQLKINGIEMRAKFDWRFMYPSFELVNWYAAQRLCEELKEANEDERPAESILLDGVKALLPYLREWMERDKKNNFSRTAANFSRTLSELNKALKKQEKHSQRRSPNGKRKPKEICASTERQTPEKKPRPVLQKQSSAFVVKQIVVASKDEIAGLALRKLSEGKHPESNWSPTSSDFTAIPTSSPESKSEMAAEHALRPLKLLLSKKQLEESTKSESEEVDDEPLNLVLPVEEEVAAEEIGAIFSKARTLHGRNVRPSMKIAGLVKDDLKEQPHSKRKGFMTQFSEDEKRQIRHAELAAEAECSAYEPAEKKTGGSVPKHTAPPRPTVIHMAPASGQKKKKPSTVKQRLASKLGLKG